MRRLRRWLLAAITLTLAAVGAAMPFAASYLQDARQTGSETRSFDSFRLTLRQEADLGRTLKLIAGSDYYVAEDEEAADARMTPEEVLAAADELMKELARFGLLEYPVSSFPRIFPQTLCANDGSVSIPTWTLDWNIPDVGEDFYVWLDDASGKAFMISLPSTSYSTAEISRNVMEPIYARTENWRAFLEEYYGTEVRIGNEVLFDYSMRLELLFPLGTAEDKAEYQLDLYYYTYGFTTLNPYVRNTWEPPPANEAAYDS